MAWKENLSVFFKGLDRKTVTLDLIPPRVIKNCYFDNGFFDVNSGETVLDTTNPRLTGVQSEWKRDGEELRTTRCTIEDVPGVWLIKEIQPEGTGTVTVTLAPQ